MNELELETNSIDPINRFAALFHKGIECWTEAGKIVASEVDKDPDFIDKICQRYPTLTHETVKGFERLGRNEFHIKALLYDGPGVRALLRLPYQLQEKYFAEPLPVLTKTENGWEVLRVEVQNLTPDLARQVFGEGDVRSEAAQRAWLESRALSKMTIKAKDEVSYKVRGRKLIVLKPTEFERSELARILAQLD